MSLKSIFGHSQVYDLCLTNHHDFGRCAILRFRTIANSICICMCQLMCAAGAEALSNFRLLQKRFVVYQPSKAAPHPPSTPGQPQSGPEQIMKTSSCHQPGTCKGQHRIMYGRNVPSVAVAAVVDAPPQRDCKTSSNCHTVPASDLVHVQALDSYLLLHSNVSSTKVLDSALERQEWSCTYLAHHELESVIVIIIDTLLLLLLLLLVSLLLLFLLSLPKG